MRALLSDLTSEEFERGVKTFILHHKEIYPNSNIIAIIRDYALSNPTDLSPEEAWGVVIAKKWSRPHKDLNNATVKEAINIMGWRNLLMSENEEADRAHFFKIYKALFDKKKLSRIMGESNE